MPRLCVIPGDGIGREVIPAALKVLQAILPDLETVEADGGWDCFTRIGTSIPESTLEAVRDCGAALFGAVSSPSKRVNGYRSAILTLRQELDLFANIRPVHSLPRLSSRQDVDLIIVRENTEGLYAGREYAVKGDDQAEDYAIAERVISRRASHRIAQRALDLARKSGRKRLTIVHKSNILPITDGLFRDCIHDSADKYFENGELDRMKFEIDEMLVDTAAYRLVSEPQWFDMIVTTNLFGDILSDAAAHWAGGLGVAPSLNWGDGVVIAEPVHGSAPDIAGKGIANPIAAILSSALLVRYGWDMPQIAARIEHAVRSALETDLPVSEGKLESSCKTNLVTTAILRYL